MVLESIDFLSDAESHKQLDSSMPDRRSHRQSSFRSIIRRIHLKKNQYHLSTDTREEYHGGLAEPF